MTEKSFEAGVVNALEILGYHVDQFSQRRRGKCQRCGCPIYAGSQQTRGIPDLRARHVPLGLVVWLEVKWDKGKLSADQTAWLEDELRAGGLAAPIWTSEDLAFVMRAAGDTRFQLVQHSRVSPVTLNFVSAWDATSRQVQPL